MEEKPKFQIIRNIEFNRELSNERKNEIKPEVKESLKAMFKDFIPEDADVNSGIEEIPLESLILMS